MMRRLVAALLVLLAARAAEAACANTIAAKDGNNSAITFCVGTDGSTGNYGNNMVVDGTSGANRLGITTNSAAKTEGVGTAGTAAGGVLTVQGVASMTKLLVTPDSVALPANQSVNVSQINGITPLMGNGTTGTGSHRVTISSDNSAVAGLGAGATGSAVPANAVLQGVNAAGNTVAPRICTNVAIYDTNTNGKTKIITGVSSQYVYICGFSLMAAGTVTVDLTQGTSTNCSSGTQTKLTPSYQLTAQSGIVDRALYWQGIKSVITQDVCIETNAAVAVQAMVYYDQGI